MNPHDTLSVPILGEHLAGVTISPLFLQALVTPAGRGYVCAQGLPSDAELVRITINQTNGTLRLIFKHPSFPAPLADGQIAEVPVDLRGFPAQLPATPVVEDVPVVLER